MRIRCAGLPGHVIPDRQRAIEDSARHTERGKGEECVRPLRSAPPYSFEQLHKVAFLPVRGADFFQVDREIGFSPKRLHQAPDDL